MGGRPWYIDILTIGIVGVWMWWSFALIQSYGPNPYIIVSNLVFGVVGMLLIYGQRLEYLQIGDRVFGQLGNVNREQEAPRGESELDTNDEESNPWEEFR